MSEPRSVIRIIWYNDVPEVSHMTAFPNSRQSNARSHDRVYCISSACSEAQVNKSFMMYLNNFWFDDIFIYVYMCVYVYQAVTTLND